MCRTLVNAKILLLLCFTLLAQDIRSQQPTVVRPPLVITNPATKLFDEFGILSSEDRSARFDRLFHEIQKSPGSVGYVLLYCGKKCQYGEIEAHIRGIEIKVALRKFDRTRLTIVHGGFREKFETELWLVADTASPPMPTSTVNIKYVTFGGTTRREFEYYDCCDEYGEFWKNLKP